MPTTASVARLEARISADLHALLKRAAEIQGRTMTDFVVSAVQAAARQAIEQAEVVRLSRADQEFFAQALLSPPRPAAALRRARSAPQAAGREVSAGPFRVVRHDAAIDRTAFRSGAPDLDSYFLRQVTQDVRRRLTACFVTVAADHQIGAYYTLASASVLLSALPQSIAKKLPRYPSVPAVRMERLAVDEKFQGHPLAGRSQQRDAFPAQPGACFLACNRPSRRTALAVSSDGAPKRTAPVTHRDQASRRLAAGARALARLTAPQTSSGTAVAP